MVVNSSRVFGLVKIALPLGIIILTLGYFARQPHDYAQYLRKFKSDKELFITDFLESEVDGPFDGSAITRLCEGKKWTKGLMLSCEPSPGGIGEVKNAHLHCIRMAIEMGAELILPDILKRSETDITKLGQDTKGPPRGIPLDYLFDREHLNHTLTTSCPQMKLHTSLNDLYRVTSLLQPVQFSIDDLTEEFVNETVIAHPEQIRQHLKAFMDEKSPPAKRHYPFRIHMVSTIYRWPTAYDPPEFARHFGGILRLRRDIRSIAAAGLFNLQKKYGIRLDPQTGIREGNYVGVHLRTEADAEGFAEYETQAVYYLKYVADTRVPLVYLATGDTGLNVTDFELRAKELDLTVILKRDLLDKPELDKLHRLSWDQRALVDYEIMLRAGIVFGLADSAFSFNIAMRRANAFGNHRDEVPVEQEGVIQYQDGFSTLFGNGVRGEVFKQSIWP